MGVGVASKFSLDLQLKGVWPPTAPIFHVGGTSLLRRFLRHFWLEAYAGFAPFILIDSPPGFGKSSVAGVMGRALDANFSESNYLYDNERFLTALHQSPEMTVHVFDDAAASRVLWSRDFSKREQKETIANLLGHARNRKQIVLVISQSGQELDRIVREDIHATWVRVVSRNPMTQKKWVQLFFPKEVLFWNKKYNVYALGSASGYRSAGYMAIPPTSDQLFRKYSKAREIGFGLKARKNNSE